jgi:PAS domain S-box-containing protein
MAIRKDSVLDERLIQTIIQSRQQWMAIMDAITDYIFVVDENGTLVMVNSTFAGAFNLHPREVIGKRCSDLLGTDFIDAGPFQGIIRDGAPRTYEKKKGEEVYQISIFPLVENNQRLAIHVMKNVTELKRLKDQLYHSDKLASIGLLVSGVAHEINNPLTGAIAYSELLQMKVKDEEVLGDLKKIQDSAERCKKIVDNLLTFSRQRTPTKSLESINGIIDRAIDLRAYWLKSSGIEVVRNYDAVTTVFVDAQQIQQVILNILLNAEQAIVNSGRRDGQIVFSTKYERDHREVSIMVRDNGPGIPPSSLPKIFDPFFTTKPVGIGTGLGLSISHGIITEHGGTIQAANAEGGGAVFTIDLPTGIDPRQVPGGSSA